MTIDESQPALVAEHDGAMYRFCAEFYRSRFRKAPGRYLRAGGR
jgi:YHS domain-containing protein